MQLPLTAERIHREIIKLLILVGIAAAAFVGTRAFAAASRTASLRDAARWYAAGRQRLERGDLAAAVDALRRATLKDRANRAYALALARAEARAGQPGPAERTLLALRDLAPEDPEVNVELARAAAARADVPQAVRYYHHGIYGLWPAGDGPDRVRIELIEFLLRRGERRLALAELLAATTDPVDGAAANVRIGRLFLAAGEPRRARDHFERALRAEPASDAALAGAGIAAFHTGDYRAAGRYLRAVPDGEREAREARELANLVLTNDPLDARLSPAERQRRLSDGLAHLRRRLDACATPTADSIRRDLDAFARRFASPGGRTRETIEDGLDLLYRAEHTLVDACGPGTAVDRAWLLIGERHGASG